MTYKLRPLFNHDSPHRVSTDVHPSAFSSIGNVGDVFHAAEAFSRDCIAGGVAGVASTKGPALTFHPLAYVIVQLRQCLGSRLHLVDFFIVQPRGSDIVP